MHYEIRAVGPCAKCGNTLRAIGTARVGGGQTHGDWAKQTLHTKCWKQELEKDNLRE